MGKNGMNREEELTLTYSGVVPREGRNAVCIRFERRDGKDYAEGLLPSCEITEHRGFTAEELEMLRSYLKENEKELREKARELNQLKNWFR